MTGLAIAAMLAAAGCSGLTLVMRRASPATDAAAARTGIGADLPAALISFVLTGCAWRRGV